MWGLGKEQEGKVLQPIFGDLTRARGRGVLMWNEKGRLRCREKEEEGESRVGVWCRQRRPAPVQVFSDPPSFSPQCNAMQCNVQ